MAKNKLYFIIIVSYTTVYSMRTPTAGLSWGNLRNQGTLVFPEKGITLHSTPADNYATAMDFTVDGRHLMVFTEGGHDEGQLTVFGRHADVWTPAKIIDVPIVTGGMSFMLHEDNNLSVSPCGKYCALLRADPNGLLEPNETSLIELYDARTGEHLYALPEGGRIIGKVVFDKSGRSFAKASHKFCIFLIISLSMIRVLC